MLKKSLLCVLFLFSINTVNASADTGGSDIKSQVLSDPESAQLGKNRYGGLCAYCHGIDGGGGKGKKLKGKDYDPDYLFETITNGRQTGGKKMPPYKKLSEEVRWQLVAFILSIGAKK